MRILTVTSSYPKYPGDVTAPFIESIVNALAKRAHQIDVVLPAHPDLKRPETDLARFFPFRYAPSDRLCVWGYAQSLQSDVRLRRGMLWLAPVATLAMRRMVKRLLAARSYDVAHIHWIVPNAVPLAGMLWKKRLPFVISLHGSDVHFAERSRWLRLASRRTFARAGAVTACSDDLRLRAIRLGAPDQRTRTVAYGVDVELFSPANRQDRTRARFGISAGETLVVAVGRLVEKKGFSYLLDALAQCSQTRLLLIGEGDLRRSLQEQAQRLHAPVTFAGAQDRSQTAAALADADIVAVPSVVDSAGNVDGLPNVLLEALACGRAIVASRVAGIPDIVTDGVNGLLVQPQAASALATAIDSLRSAPDVRERLGREARRTAVQRLSWDATAQSLEDCFAQATALETR